METGKTGKYFKYAIGEIVLVVIGILIALWINQKYNYSQERQDEINVLKEIRINLDSDYIEITADIIYMDSVGIAYRFVKNYLDTNDSPNNEFGSEVLKLRTTPHFNPNLSGYNLLVSKGIEIIKNNELRKTIAYHFESTYTYYKAYEQERIQFRIHQMEPIFIKYFDYESNPKSTYMGEYRIDNEDYTKIKSNTDFSKFISSIKRENDLVQNRAYRLQQSINDLSELLDKELNNK